MVWWSFVLLIEFDSPVLFNNQDNTCGGIDDDSIVAAWWQVGGGENSTAGIFIQLLLTINSQNASVTFLHRVFSSLLLILRIILLCLNDLRVP